MREVEFFYDMRSPYAYFAWHRRRLLEDAGIRILFKPISIDVLLNLQAGREPWAEYIDPLAPPKRQHLLADIPRMAAYWKIPITGPRGFKPRSKRAMCVATRLFLDGVDQREFVDAAFKALWIDSQDIDDEAVLGNITSSLSLHLPSDGVEQAALAELTALTEASYQEGVFGVPSFRHGGKVYFGADRMDVLAAELAGR
ncbi:2-hydroxychromene-2-carboxylate isomerase [Erythrobacter mangrovi]|uniref:2-hydroxychromene-2-carboxylate isomerase n=1 Tax=Erythrobacter mangrovi TaxID=2739433 RepID=A0A7D4B654_9SPHN|nr:DsbA family protein [Erythrobacter mangrovi]QKG70063.1 DsbA family protein [Erythrobacter mangrovi]